MGQEMECRLQHQGRESSGRAQLEGDHILFKGEERLRINLRELRSVRAADGLLHLELAGGEVTLVLGAAAEKWADKILHPPSRAKKLGLEAGLAVRVEGEFGNDFLKEVEALPSAGKAKADLVFLAAPVGGVLKKVPKLAAMLKPAGALWIVYPKGVETIREIEVIEAGRAAGLKDTKVIAFSATHTALRFVIPVAARAR